MESPLSLLCNSQDDGFGALFSLIKVKGENIKRREG